MLVFTISMPGRLKSFAALTSKERRAVYAGWWAAAKKEGRHYWVGLLLQGGSKLKGLSIGKGQTTDWEG